MILTCPECTTRYQTDASQFAPDGRKVRCAKCGHVWFQAAPQPEPEAGLEEESVTPPEPEAEPAAAPKREAYAPPRVEAVASPARGRFSSRPPLLGTLVIGAGWVLLGVIVLGVGWSGLHYRQSIASLWPQSSSLYADLGMQVNTRGLEFHDKTAHFETDGQQDVLVITGHLLNTTSRELSVPAIRVSLMDADRHELYHWNFSAGISILHPGQLATFHTQLSSPPAAARAIELRFAAERSN
ncbi:MAG TPA: MJ0042-type zinc finger domain-containing protein [Rhizomicrobium sp.]|nr:MJ0042-type zinc finger domain-containing protein [Rhizomicrobium sp.]